MVFLFESKRILITFEINFSPLIIFGIDIISTLHELPLINVAIKDVFTTLATRKKLNFFEIKNIFIRSKLLAEKPALD